MADRDWSTLPPELINRIALSFLDTGDLDYYIDYRAVCRTWRSATADPKTNTNPSLFRPRHWAMLDEVFQTDARLFNLPLLGRRYRLVSTVPGAADLVVAEATPPHAVRVLNPFTGAVARFAAPLPFYDGAVDARVIGVSPTLVLIAYSSSKVYFADPDSESFAVYEEAYACALIRLAVAAGRYDAAGEVGSVASILIPEAIKAVHPVAVQITDISRGNPKFLARAHGDDLLQIFKIRTAEEGGSVIFDEKVKGERLTGGGRAIVVGETRCLSINASKFASIDSDCMYYQEYSEVEYSGQIYMYSLESKETVKIGEAINSLNPIFLFEHPPFSPIQLLCSYGYEAWRFRPVWENTLQQLPRELPADMLASLSLDLGDEFEDFEDELDG
uniref:DUF295 domain-containing protein n=1 Tax=Leersia perrieri TaxID=77586 RepID=A0A0D9VZT5_9ORYZ